MLFKILVGFALLILAFVVVVATRPAAFRIARSIVMDAPPERAFALVNDFHEWAAWSPYEKLDPRMQKRFEGPRSGVGSVYRWSGNDKAGTGAMTIERSDSPSLVALRLEFEKPFAATNLGTFTFAREGRGTKVIWSMEGHNNFMSKAFSLVMNMDKLVGSDFERGLAAMKAAAEATPNDHVAHAPN